MSFDAHSLERLRQLGRTLPQPLPKPQEPAEQSSRAAAASERRHRVETETNPEALFRELMQVSPDGSVPPHLLDRLRQAEATQQQQQRRPATPSPAAALRRQRGQRQTPQDDHQELYTAFQQLLLEDEDEDED